MRAGDAVRIKGPNGRKWHGIIKAVVTIADRIDVGDGNTLPGRSETTLTVTITKRDDT